MSMLFVCRFHVVVDIHGREKSKWESIKLKEEQIGDIIQLWALKLCEFSLCWYFSVRDHDDKPEIGKISKPIVVSSHMSIQSDSIADKSVWRRWKIVEWIKFTWSSQVW